MDWLTSLFAGTTTAGILLAVALVSAGGFLFGMLKIRGIGLGVAGVLFAGMTWGYWMWHEDPPAHAAPPPAAVAMAAGSATAPEAAVAPAVSATAAKAAAAHHQGLERREAILEFLREFGLALFVYAIGVQVGPGFLGRLRAQGLRYNGLAVANVAIGVGIAALLCAWFALPGPQAVGVMSGAVTNTPGLAAAQQALKERTADGQLASLLGAGYALAYPIGIFGVIAVMIGMRLATGYDPSRPQPAPQGAPPIQTRGCAVRNPGLAGKTIRDLVAMVGGQALVSRLRRDGAYLPPTADCALRAGDEFLAVGRTAALDEIEVIAGGRSERDLAAAVGEGGVEVRHLVVTRKEVVGRRIGEADPLAGYGVAVTRVTRAGVELLATGDVELQLGDRLRAVGAKEALDRFAGVVGNAPAHLDHPHLIPIMLGIGLGLILGSLPIWVPGIPKPLKLGLAGGPLVVALVCAARGRIGPLDFYMPNASALLMRELGITLFLACVGLKSGDAFVATFAQGEGWKLLGIGLAITVSGPLIVGTVARLWFRMPYPDIIGLMAGSQTDPPALAFATATCRGEAPAAAYATVYPVTMLSRIAAAQMLVLFLPLRW